MLVLEDFGVIRIREGFLMLECLIQLLLAIDRNTTVASLYKVYEREKQRRYEQRVREVEMGSFTPLVFSSFGGMGSAATTVFKQVASLLSVKRVQFVLAAVFN